MDVYDRIDNLLKEKGVSRRKAAQIAGIPPTTLNSALTRKKGLSASAVAMLAQSLNVDAQWLLYGKDADDLDATVKLATALADEAEAKAGETFLQGLDADEKNAITLLVTNLKRNKSLHDLPEEENDG